MDTEFLDGPLFILGAVGVECTVISPPELIVAAGDWGRRYPQAGQFEAQSQAPQRSTAGTA